MELEKIQGIGSSTIKKLHSLNIYNIDDLINYYPYRYNIFKPQNIDNILDDSVVTINGMIESIPKVLYVRKNFNYLSFRVLTSNKLIKVTIFNRAFMKNNLIVGKDIALIGKYNKEKNTFIANNILLNPILNTIIEPVYHIKNTLKNKSLNKIIINSLDKYNRETLPQYIKEKYNFINEMDAIKEIHNPKDINSLKKAKLLLIYKELFEFMFKINYLKLKRLTNEVNIIKKVDYFKVEELINKLPFKLTEDQLKAINDIKEDFENNKRMNRLIIGDVGSGKTIVAVIAIYMNFLAGYQAAFLAPTEILSNQHYETIKNILKELNIEILTSSVTKKKRKEIIEKLKNKEIDLIIGTHSLINEEVEFNKLGLVITDEQHRFGVNQRKNLQSKGRGVDVLYMSATPIPRTYALTIYGDMDITEIKTKPSGRKKIITKLYTEKEIKLCLDIMLEEIKKGHQIYVVSPLVEENESNELYDVEKLKEKLNIAFNNKISIDILHGKLKNKDKEEIMNNFKINKTKILISTTVIEVGVDIKNATCMVIFNAERFGLSTLHQLRGRVGRNDLTSYCILISNYEKERLNVLVSSNDGFYISQKDFELRGSGNLFGTQQSGEMTFKIADLKRNLKILNQANIDSTSFIKENVNNNFEKFPYYRDMINLLKFID